jgi:ribosomal protein L35AE/L33A
LQIVDDYNLIGKNLLKKKGASLDPYIGKKVVIVNSDNVELSHGSIDGSFGGSGKFKVRLQNPLTNQDLKNLDIKIKYKINSWDKERKWIQQ